MHNKARVSEADQLQLNITAEQIPPYLLLRLAQIAFFGWLLHISAGFVAFICVSEMSIWVA